MYICKKNSSPEASLNKFNVSIVGFIDTEINQGSLNPVVKDGV
ncbi:UDP-N-acetylglucosamine 2-epimerase [Crocosphaera watsonii WH 0402]|uniref:UDP-N-acetylglucosamine 2-epimerase n=2 Tax=Crocosphaera watsonii TaxID=263511 RepID=T2JSS9_CROWT|nr:hypothetical protein CWATWH0005_2756 [Crocosphaera watsonii WH 0005]CCQ68893.1 UDP-N-acetylglucosamine 2-epimerase [Crocosphaera watsonii WH 0402]